MFMICVLLSLCTLSVQVDLKTCGNEKSPVTCSFFFNKVDVAFRQRDVLYTLRKAFFPSEGALPFLFDVVVFIEVASVPNVSCNSEEYAFQDYSISSPPSMLDVCGNYECAPLMYDWKHQWSKTIVSYIIEREDLELLHNTNFVAFAASAFNSFDTSVFSDDEEGIEDDNSTNSSSVSIAGDSTVEFLLTIDYLPCRPDDGVMLEAWEDILPWLQLYSRHSDNLEDVEYTQDGRGFAFREDRLRHGGLTIPILTVIHILLNIMLALGATYMLHKYHRHLNQMRGKQYQLVASMYWSVVFVCLLGATVIVIGNCYLYYALIFIDNESPSVFGFRVSSDITVTALVVIELIASMLTPHDPTFFIPHLIRRTLCFNQCCRCCGSRTRLNILRRAILGVAMWIIMLFLQLVTASVLPLAVVIVVNPVPSLAFLSIMVSLFFCLVVFVAYFMNAFEGNYLARHRLSKEMRRRSTITLLKLKNDLKLAGNWTREKLILVIQAFVFLVIFVIVSLIIILYLNFVQAGADTNNVGGLFISLVPSAILGGITWVAKKHLFKDLEKEIEAEKDQKANNDSKPLQSIDSVFTIGGISIRPKEFLRRSSRKKRDRLIKSTNSDECSPEVADTQPVGKAEDFPQEDINNQNHPQDDIENQTFPPFDSVVNMESPQECLLESVVNTDNHPNEIYVNVSLQDDDHNVEEQEEASENEDNKLPEQEHKNDQ